jgi:16S rRNA (cytosine967-C5)-methyltransferase
MRRSSLFGHTAELLDLVLASRQPADILARQFFRDRRYLGARDRRFIADRLYDILRYHDRLAFFLGRALVAASPGGMPGRMPGIGLCAAHAIHLMGESPETLLPDVAGIWRTVSSDVDPAVLLQALKGAEVPQTFSEPGDRLALLYSMPKFIVREWLERFEDAEALCAASNAPAPTTLRVNRLRMDREACRSGLAQEGVPARLGVLAPDALVLEKRCNLPGLRAYREGWIEVQDEGSQLIGILLRPKPGERIVDFCAGGGGKTLHMAAMMENRGVILSLDIAQERLKSLEGRAVRAGVSIAEVRVTSSPDPSWEESADGVLVDAPCSGTGTLRRNPGAKLHLSAEGVRSLHDVQCAVLRGGAGYVRPGGRLLYSTCSLLRSENEQVVEEFLASRGDFRLLSPLLPLREAGVGLGGGDDLTLTLLPHRHGTDGFFGALMERSA